MPTNKTVSSDISNRISDFLNSVSRDYVKAMRNNTAPLWGGDIELKKIAEILNIRINVYKDQFLQPQIGPADAPEVNLSLINKHYELLIPNGCLSDILGKPNGHLKIAEPKVPAKGNCMFDACLRAKHWLKENVVLIPDAEGIRDIREQVCDKLDADLNDIRDRKRVVTDDGVKRRLNNEDDVIRQLFSVLINDHEGSSLYAESALPDCKFVVEAKKLRCQRLGLDDSQVLSDVALLPTYDIRGIITSGNVIFAKELAKKGVVSPLVHEKVNILKKSYYYKFVFGGIDCLVDEHFISGPWLASEIRKNNLEIIECLVLLGATNLTKEHLPSWEHLGKSPLGCVLENVNAGALEILLKYGEASFEQMQGIMEHALSHGHAEIVKVLLKHEVALPETLPSYQDLKPQLEGAIAWHRPNFSPGMQLVDGGFIKRCNAELNLYNSDIVQKSDNKATDKVIDAYYKLFSLVRSFDGVDVDSLKLALKCVIDNGAYINQREAGTYKTPLHIATEIGSQMVIDLLIEMGASLELEDISGNTPIDILRGDEYVEGDDLLSEESLLHIAAAEGELGEIVILLKEGKSIEAKNAQGLTAIDVARKFGNLKSVVLLAMLGAALPEVGINIDDEESEVLDRIDFFITYANILRKQEFESLEVDSIHPKSGHTPMTLAAANSDEESIAAIYNWHSPLLNQANFHGNTPLMVAVEVGSLETVSYLVNLGANLADKSKLGITALMLAEDISKESEEHKKIVAFLKFSSWVISKGLKDFNPESILKSGESYLTYTVRYNNQTLLPLLVELEVDLDALNEHGLSALHVATSKADKPCIEWLITKGASVEVINSYGENLVESAIKAGNSDIADFLLSKGAPAGSSIQTRNDISVNLQNFLEKNRFSFTNLSVVNAHEETPLIVAAKNNNHNLVVELLSFSGETINHVDQNGICALWYAAFHGNNAMVQALLGVEGINVMLESNDGRTPFVVACQAKHFELAELLKPDDGPLPVTYLDVLKPIPTTDVSEVRLLAQKSDVVFGFSVVSTNHSFVDILSMFDLNLENFSKHLLTYQNSKTFRKLLAPYWESLLSITDIHEKLSRILHDKPFFKLLSDKFKERMSSEEEFTKIVESSDVYTYLVEACFGGDLSEELECLLSTHYPLEILNVLSHLNEARLTIWGEDDSGCLSSFYCYKPPVVTSTIDLYQISEGQWQLLQPLSFNKDEEENYIKALQEIGAYKGKDSKQLISDTASSEDIIKCLYELNNSFTNHLATNPLQKLITNVNNNLSKSLDKSEEEVAGSILEVQAAGAKEICSELLNNRDNILSRIERIHKNRAKKIVELGQLESDVEKEVAGAGDRKDAEQHKLADIIELLNNLKDECIENHRQLAQVTNKLGLLEMELSLSSEIFQRSNSIIQNTWRDSLGELIYLAERRAKVYSDIVNKNISSATYEAVYLEEAVTQLIHNFPDLLFDLLTEEQVEIILTYINSLVAEKKGKTNIDEAVVEDSLLLSDYMSMHVELLEERLKGCLADNEVSQTVTNALDSVQFVSEQETNHEFAEKMIEDLSEESQELAFEVSNIDWDENEDEIILQLSKLEELFDDLEDELAKTLINLQEAKKGLSGSSIYEYARYQLMIEDALRKEKEIRNQQTLAKERYEVYSNQLKPFLEKTDIANDWVKKQQVQQGLQKYLYRAQQSANIQQKITSIGIAVTQNERVRELVKEQLSQQSAGGMTAQGIKPQVVSVNLDRLESFQQRSLQQQTQDFVSIQVLRRRKELDLSKNIVRGQVSAKGKAFNQLITKSGKLSLSLGCGMEVRKTGIYEHEHLLINHLSLVYGKKPLFPGSIHKIDPSWSTHDKGRIAEYMVKEFIKSLSDSSKGVVFNTNWATKINGNQGIDIVATKEVNGAIAKVLLIEVKFKSTGYTASLGKSGPNKEIVQMSDRWVDSKLNKMKESKETLVIRTGKLIKKYIEMNKVEYHGGVVNSKGDLSWRFTKTINRKDGRSNPEHFQDNHKNWQNIRSPKPEAHPEILSDRRILSKSAHSLKLRDGGRDNLAMKLAEKQCALFEKSYQKAGIEAIRNTVAIVRQQKPNLYVNRKISMMAKQPTRMPVGGSRLVQPRGAVISRLAKTSILSKTTVPISKQAQRVNTQKGISKPNCIPTPRTSYAKASCRPSSFANNTGVRARNIASQQRVNQASSTKKPAQAVRPIQEVRRPVAQAVRRPVAQSVRQPLSSMRKPLPPVRKAPPPRKPPPPPPPRR